MILLKNTNINRSTSFLEASTFTKLLLRFHNYISIYCLITTPDNTGVFRPKIHWMHKVVQSAENPSFKYHDLFLQ